MTGKALEEHLKAPTNISLKVITKRFIYCRLLVCHSTRNSCSWPIVRVAELFVLPRQHYRLGDATNTEMERCDCH